MTGDPDILKLTTLSDHYASKATALHALQAEIGDRKHEAEVEIDRQYADRLEAAKREYNDSFQALQIEKDRQAISAARPRYPVGTVLRRWKRPVWGTRANMWEPTDDLGVVEVVDRNTEHPDNMKYSRASCGTVIIRKIKRDGEKSKNYVAPRSDYVWGEWVPDGVEHPSKEGGHPCSNR